MINIKSKMKCSQDRDLNTQSLDYIAIAVSVRQLGNINILKTNISISVPKLLPWINMDLKNTSVRNKNYRAMSTDKISE